MNTNTNIIRSAAIGIIRPTATGFNSAATGMNNTIIRPAANGLKTVATGVNNTIIRPAVDPIYKLATMVTGDSKDSESLKNSDAGSKDSTSHSTLSEVEEEQEEEEEEEEPPPVSILQYLVVDGQVNSEELQSAIHNMYSAHVASSYEGRQEEQEEPDSAIGTALDASSLLINEFALLISENPEILETIQQAIDDYIFPRISLMYTDASTLRASEVAKLISFADLYNDALSEKGMTVSKDRLASFEELATEYLRRAVHDQMKLMISNSLRLRNEEPPRLNAQGLIVTGNPEDVSYIMKMQLAVARDHLPPRFLSEVLAACNLELENMLGDIMLDVESNWKQRRIEHLCAAVNDTAALIEQCEELNESVLDPNNAQHVEAGENLLTNLTELSLHAVRFVCERIMLDVREPDPLLTRVGTPAWEQGSDPIISSTIRTLDDYFSDVELWIVEGYFYPKVLRHCFDMTLQTYVDAFFANTMAKGIKDPLVVSRELQQDWQELNQFFCAKDEQAVYLGHAGHHSKEEATRRLGVIQALSFLMTPSITPSKLEPEINTILRQFGTEAGITALLHIAGLRNRHISTNEAAEWHQIAKEAVEAFVDEDASKVKPVFTLPDIRDSKYITRVRSANNELNDSLRSAGLDNLPHRNSIRKRWGASFRASGRRLMKSDRTLLSTWKQKDEVAAPNALPDNVSSEYSPDGAKVAQPS